MSNLRDAFEFVCINAIRHEGVFVSIYLRSPFYGGPEEGGWWGEDVTLEAYQRFDFMPDAVLAIEAMREAVENETNDAKKAFNDQCSKECAWLERRGLDDSALPEVDGADSYFIRIETTRGSFESTGARHYE